MLLLFDRRNFSKPSSHFLPDPNICPNRLNTDLGTSSLSGRVSLPNLSHKRCFLPHRTHNFPLRRTFASVFPFPSIGDISGPSPDQKERPKDTKHLPTRCPYFRKKSLCANENKTSPESLPQWGSESLLASPRTQSHRIVPRGSHDPPRRPVRHPYGTVLDHFAIHIGLLIRDKFRYEFWIKFSTSSLFFE